MPKPTFHNLAGHKREQLTEAILDEFSDRSYRSASLDRIAAAGGVSKGSLYQYFDGKGAMYRWLLTEELPRRKVAALKLAPEDPSRGLFATLEGAFLAGLELYVQEPRLARLGVALMRPADEPEIADLHHLARTQSHGYLKGMVIEAQQRGEVRPGLDPDLAAVFIAKVMGDGLSETMLLRLDISALDYARDPTVVQRRLAKEDLVALVGEAGDLLRRAIGTA